MFDFELVRNYANIIGLSGAAIYVGVYFLTATDRLPSQSPYFYVFNLMAASLVAVNLTANFNLAALAIQSFYILISILGLYQHIRFSVGQNPQRTHTKHSSAKQAAPCTHSYPVK